MYHQQMEKWELLVNMVFHKKWLNIIDINRLRFKTLIQQEICVGQQLFCQSCLFLVNLRVKLCLQFQFYSMFTMSKKRVSLISRALLTRDIRKSDVATRL